MPAIEVRRTVPTAVQPVWEALTDFDAYGRWIPLTHMRVDPPPVRLGWSFAGRTGLGPLGFLDSMLLVRWEPPTDGVARFAVRKTGRILAGWADVQLLGTPTGGTDVRWREEILPRPETLGRLLAPATDRVAARLFGQALDAMLADAAFRASAG